MRRLRNNYITKIQGYRVAIERQERDTAKSVFKVNSEIIIYRGRCGKVKGKGKVGKTAGADV